MIGQTLSFYLAKNFLRNTVFVFLVFFFLIALVDMLELSRRTARIEDVSFLDVFSIVMLRAPVLSENIVPFAVLFGASASLLLLSKRLELVVARASGVSVWQFLAPVCVADIGRRCFCKEIGGSSTSGHHPEFLDPHCPPGR